MKGDCQEGELRIQTFLKKLNFVQLLQKKEWMVIGKALRNKLGLRVGEQKVQAFQETCKRRGNILSRYKSALKAEFVAHCYEP